MNLQKQFDEDNLDEWWMETCSLTMLRSEVNIRSMQEEQLGKICVGSFIIWDKP